MNEDYSQSTNRIFEAIHAQHLPLTISGDVPKAQECDHKGHYRLVNGMYVAIRICTECGKSWRLPTRGEYSDELPDAIWEEIDEPAKGASPVLPDYED